jgi:hypothetical protein
MLDRRKIPRLLCAEIVDVSWRDDGGRANKSAANLEDISLAGACLQVDSPIPLGTTVRITHAQGELAGTVKHCVFHEIGYFLGIEFDPGSRWSAKQLKLQHLLDPRELVLQTIDRELRTRSRAH